MANMLHGLGQSFNIPNPTLTEKNLPDQGGRVFIVTGGYAGVGLELSHILYSHNATVYMAGRSPEKAKRAIESIRSSFPDSKGRIEFLQVDFADLTTIKKAVEEFTSRETRLDVLTNNAGVMTPPKGSKSAQDFELQMGTNVLGSFLFTKGLLSLIQKTAKTAEPGSVRITWAASLVVDVNSPPNGVVFEDNGAPKVHSNQGTNYGQSKASNVFLASEFARRYPFAESRIITNAWNPGNLKSELQRHVPTIQRKAIGFILYDARYGAYTELFAGWSDEAGKEVNNGKYIAPWGRISWNRKDVEEARGSGVAQKLWEWCEHETSKYA